jgi:hypothetical protein
MRYEIDTFIYRDSSEAFDYTTHSKSGSFVYLSFFYF